MEKLEGGGKIVVICESIICFLLGNNLMKTNQFAEAVKYYTAAIDLDNQNAIYYGNR